MIRKKILFILLTLLISNKLIYSQNAIGLPTIKSYTTEDFHAGTQSWGMAQDKNGVLYFANNSGLLSYDGTYWKLYTLPNATIIRSVVIDSKGRIIVGGQDEIGYFFPDKNGILSYNSLKQLIPPTSRQFGDIWNVVLNDDDVFFRATDRIFHLKNASIDVFYPTSEWLFLEKSDNHVYAQDKTKGLLIFKNNGWDVYSADPFIQNNILTAISNYTEDTLLITTLKKGIFCLTRNSLSRKYTILDKELINYQIYTAKKLNDNRFAIGTISNGCYVINHQGALVQKFTKREGIQNNNILSLFLDRDLNLWLGLDNGIDFIAYNSSVKHIYPDKENQTTGYTSKIFNNDFFIGTSNGLFKTKLEPSVSDFSYSKGEFTRVSNTDGQVWSLSVLNQQLLMGHNEGTFLIKDNTAVQLQSGEGTWFFQPLNLTSPFEDIVVGSYTGLKMLHFKNNTLTSGEPFQLLRESLRFLAYDVNNNIIWASHPYRGIFKFLLSADKSKVLSYQLYNIKDGLPSDLGNYVFNIKNRIVFTTTKGIYEYNMDKNAFVPSPLLYSIFGEKQVVYLKEDSYGNIWFISEGKIGVIDFETPKNNSSFSIIYFPELQEKILEGFENIYQFDKENIFIAAKKGIIHLNYYEYKRSTAKLNVILGQVKAIDKKDSIIFGGYFSDNYETKQFQSSNKIISLPHNWNSFQFQYSSTLFSQSDNIDFSYQLVPFDKTWSEWSKKTEKDYTNLPYGTYTFYVKSRNNLGNESKSVAYTFKVLPAWYQTNYAYTTYTLIILLLIIATSRYLKNQFEKQQLLHMEEQSKLKYLHQLEIDKSDKEIVKLHNEKLETEVNYKNKELASATMNLLERGKLLSKIKEEIKQLLQTHNSTSLSAEFKNILKLLTEAENTKDEWEQFSIHFDEVHNNFLKDLKTKVPELSSTDLKLCAYLRMNLSSKEIAHLMNISVKGVEISRYRLRKKLQIPTEVNLYDYLMEIKNALPENGNTI